MERKYTLFCLPLFLVAQMISIFFIWKSALLARWAYNLILPNKLLPLLTNIATWGGVNAGVVAVASVVTLGLLYKLRASESTKLFSVAVFLCVEVVYVVVLMWACLLPFSCINL